MGNDDCQDSISDSPINLLTGRYYPDNTQVEHHIVNMMPNDSIDLSIDGIGIKTDTIFEGLGHIHPLYGSIITDYIQIVFKSLTPNDGQLLLIQAIVFNKNDNNLRALCI